MQLSSIKSILDGGLSASKFWSRFKNSEFYNYLVTFLSQIWYRNTQAMEVRLMEGHISQAQQPSSIRAHAQDRTYIPGKRVPTRIQVSVSNPTSDTLSITDDMSFTNELDGFSYLCPEGAIIEPGAELILEFIQAQKVVRSYEITEEQPYIEILFDAELSASLASFEVRVEDPDRGISNIWEPTYLFRNTTADDRVYVERATALGQNGFMFGDGVSSGRIPAVGSVVYADCLITEGAISVADEQNLIPDDEVLADSLVMRTGLTLSTGSDREEIESIRKNAQYSTIYDNKTVWDNDYKFYVARNFPGLSFLSVWGEKGQEVLKGFKSEDFRQKIYICAYHPTMSIPNVSAGIQSVCDELDAVAYNKTHIPVMATLAPYTISVTGRALTSRKVDDVISSIKLSLAEFTSSNTEHNGGTTEDDIYDAIRQLSILTGFKVEFSHDLSTKVAIDTFRYLDLSGSTFSITY